MLESIQPYIGVLGCALAVILLVYCIILHIRLGSLTKKLITSATIYPFPLHCLMAIIMGFAFPVSMAEMTLVFSVNQL